VVPVTPTLVTRSQVSLSLHPDFRVFVRHRCLHETAYPVTSLELVHSFRSPQRILVNGRLAARQRRRLGCTLLILPITAYCTP
jgi:hypothetical protein